MIKLHFSIILLFTLSIGYAQQLEWVKYIGNKYDGKKHLSDIAIDNNGNSYICGTFSETLDFDPGIGINEITSGKDSHYINKLDVDGNYVWTYIINPFPLNSPNVTAYISQLSLDKDNLYFSSSFDVNSTLHPSGIKTGHPIGEFDKYLITIKSEEEIVLTDKILLVH